MRKRGLFAGLAAFALVAAAVLLVSSLSLALPSARQDIEARLQRLTGSAVHVDGKAEFSLFPRARMTLTDVRIGTAAGGDPMVLDVDRVEADFGILPALTGRAEIRRVTLIRPELSNGATEADAPDAAAAAAAPVPAPAASAASAGLVSRATSERIRLFLGRFEGLRELRVRDGLFRPGGGGPGVSNANLSFEWPGGTGSASLVGSYVWNGEPTAVDVHADAPMAFFAGSNSPIRLQLTSPAIEAAFVGEGAAGDALRLSGGLRLSAPSLSRAIRWLGDSPVSLPDLGAFTIETQIQIVDDRVSLGAASLDLGGNGAQGALEAVLPGAGGRPSVSGTLAFDRLDFGAVTQAIAPAPRNLLDLQRPIRVDFVRRLDMDLRLSAREATLGRATAGEVAATVKLVGGVGTVDIGDMSVFGGRGEMRVALDARLARPSLILTAGLRDVRAADLAALTDGVLPLASGTGSLDLTLRSPAVNWGEILTGNRGELKIAFGDGMLRGVDRTMLRTAGQQVLAVAGGEASQPFRTLHLEARSLGTKLRLDDLLVVMEDGEAKASGIYDVRTAELDLNGEVRTSTVEASGAHDSFTTSKPLGFTVKGEWPKPVMTVGGAPLEPI